MGKAIIITDAIFYPTALGKIIRGGATPIYLTGISISGVSNVVVGGTAQYSINYSPSNTTQTGVVWSITSGAEYATIDQNGLVTTTAIGTVTVRATSTQNTAIYGSATLNVTAEVPITGI